jgi:hypothetical protein
LAIENLLIRIAIESDHGTSDGERVVRVRGRRVRARFHGRSVVKGASSRRGYRVPQTAAFGHPLELEGGHAARIRAAWSVGRDELLRPCAAQLAIGAWLEPKQPF